jgi:hypothetical protein
MKQNGKKGQILILMAVTLMAILLTTTLVSVRTFKPIAKDPKATVLLIKTQTRRAVLNSLALSSLSADTDTTKFSANLHSQFRNIATANPGVSIGIVAVQTLQFSWLGEQGTTTAVVKLRVVESGYKLDWTDTQTYALQLNVNAAQSQSLRQFVQLTLNATLLMNGGASIMKNANVTVNGASYPCAIAKNVGNGMHTLTATIPKWSGPPTLTLIATDGNGIRSACTFVLQ